MRSVKLVVFYTFCKVSGFLCVLQSSPFSMRSVKFVVFYTFCKVRGFLYVL